MESLPRSRAPVQIRRISAADQDALSRFYAGLTEDSRYARFHAVSSGIDDRAARSLCGPDHEHREGFVAVATGPIGEGEIVGHLCLEPCEGGMEMAVAVADDWQRQGVGRALLDAALAWTADHGVGTLEASMLTTNAAVLGLIRSVGRPIRLSAPGAGVVRATIELARPTPRPDDVGLSRTGRPGSKRRVRSTIARTHAVQSGLR